jgi:hypothetical protein
LRIITLLLYKCIWNYSGPLTYELNSFARASRKSRLFFP